MARSLFCSRTPRLDGLMSRWSTPAASSDTSASSRSIPQRSRRSSESRRRSRSTSASVSSPANSRGVPCGLRLVLAKSQLFEPDDARLLARVERGQHLGLGVESLRRVVVDSDLEDSNFVIGLAISHKKTDSRRPGSESPDRLQPPNERAGRGIEWVDRRVTTGRAQPRSTLLSFSRNAFTSRRRSLTTGLVAASTRLRKESETCGRSAARSSPCSRSSRCFAAQRRSWPGRDPQPVGTSMRPERRRRGGIGSRRDATVPRVTQASATRSDSP